MVACPFVLINILYAIIAWISKIVTVINNNIAANEKVCRV